MASFGKNTSTTRQRVCLDVNYSPACASCLYGQRKWQERRTRTVVPAGRETIQRDFKVAGVAGSRRQLVCRRMGGHGVCCPPRDRNGWCGRGRTRRLGRPQSYTSSHKRMTQSIPGGASHGDARFVKMRRRRRSFARRTGAIRREPTSQSSRSKNIGITTPAQALHVAVA